MYDTSANKSYPRTIINLSTAGDSSRQSMITTGRSKRQRRWAWCQTICSTLRQDCLPWTKTCSRLARSQRSNQTHNLWEFSSESVVTPAWSQITHETWTKDTSTLRTGNHLTSSTTTFRCLVSNDSTSARSPHKVWWCRTLCSVTKIQTVTLVASTPSVKLHLRKLRYIINNHLGQTIKMSRCSLSTISPSQMVLSSEVKISSKFLMRLGPELAGRTWVINRLPTLVRLARVLAGRRQRVRRDQALAKTCLNASGRIHLKDSNYAQHLRAVSSNKLTSHNQGSLCRQVAKNREVFRTTLA